ncbi:hypothetical protein [Streptomyces sp. NPDC056628]|uniref:hypothetical protein n=1 Tax=Streptomyces sp. NPDC056628 TaxID=3345882 RepID=UPI0036AEF67C
MKSTRRIAAAVGLAAGLTGLAAPLADAAPMPGPDAGLPTAVTTLDSLAVSGVPADRQGRMPRPSEQLTRLDQLKELSRAKRPRDFRPVDTPVTRMLPAL